EVNDSLVAATALLQERGETVVRIRVARIAAQYFVVLDDGLRGLPLLEQRESETVASSHVVGFEAKRFSQMCDALVVAPEINQRRPQVVMHARVLEAEPHCLAVVSNSRFNLPLPVECRTEIVFRFGIPGS